MKKFVVVIFLVSIMLSNCSNDDDDNLVPLTQAEINDLKFIREEEKLARDVYLFSLNKYQLIIFDNISTSEQTHMDSVLGLLNKYGISDPASTQIGVFANSELQTLYDNLITQSNISSSEALIVGATIEDLDINDIDQFTINTTKPDLLNVYNNLVCGSKNHLRFFVNDLETIGINYTPQFISLEEYNLIINATNTGCGKNKLN
jgi:hypothetical protein